MKENIKNSTNKKISKPMILLEIIFVICAIASIPSLLSNFGKIPLENTYYTVEIVSTIFVILGVIIAVWQYCLYCRDSERNLNVITVQKAIDLSEYYKNEILFYYAPIQYIFDKSDISSILSKIDFDKIEHFDQRELGELLSADDISKLKQIQKSKEFVNVVINAHIIYGVTLSENLIKQHIQETKNQQDSKTNDENSITTNMETVGIILERLITTTLNNMEYFSLHFTHNTADESVVYKSLHQTYVSFVQLLYYHIANCNPLSTTKYYTNVIELYKLWHKRSTDSNNEFASNLRSLSNNGTIIEKK